MGKVPSQPQSCAPWSSSGRQSTCSDKHGTLRGSVPCFESTTQLHTKAGEVTTAGAHVASAQHRKLYQLDDNHTKVGTHVMRATDA
jgi:hypothetical protein